MDYITIKVPVTMKEVNTYGKAGLKELFLDLMERYFTPEYYNEGIVEELLASRTRRVSVTWETDGNRVRLPKVVKVPMSVLEDEISEYLSSNYGWLVSGWNFVDKDEEN